ncbi:NUDIX domain-containing protein [Ornithinimicrobium sufpigmenti]|uniref:NUDIX domain-containing protein n=1 Tax=Ornithinimicrobium sufpigmenti TaxID=2508882 RepID=UPI001035F8BC|nr:MULTISPECIES: NUDIX domain-containing protein [unclassified Ornithinimicrobium]
MGHVELREPSQADAGVTRHFTVAVFVVHAGHVALHPHRKLGLWLPPGGHIEMHELPDDAARREAWEETGVAVRLVGSPGITHDELDEPGAPRQLLRPEGVQVEDISHDPPHQHIDLIYFAVPDEPAMAGLAPGELPVIGAAAGGDVGMQWVDEAGLLIHPLTEEVRVWARLALAEVPRRTLVS